MGPDTWFNGEVKHRSPYERRPRESEHVDIIQVHEPSEPESLVSNDPTALPGIAVFLPSDHLAPECTPPSANTARRLARNGNIEDFDIPDYVDEKHVDTDVDMMGLVDSESESEYGDNGNIDPTSSSDSEDRHGSDLVSPPVTDDGRCGASTKLSRPRTDRPQPKPESVQEGPAPKRTSRAGSAQWQQSRALIESAIAINSAGYFGLKQMEAPYVEPPTPAKESRPIKTTRKRAWRKWTPEDGELGFTCKQECECDSVKGLPPQ